MPDVKMALTLKSQLPIGYNFELKMELGKVSKSR
jgi:hypothetical protein